jgi:phosphoribosylanthranilate isomerase
MSARTRIKICGVSRPEDIAAAVDAGADAVGFVFYPPSPRFVTPERAGALAAALPPYVTPVGLFVNAEPAAIADAAAAVPSLVLQFHGDETPERCAAAGRPYLRAARMTPGFDLLDFARRFDEAQGLLLDAHVEAYGGSGKVFDWSLVPRGVPHRLVLSGGLHAGNVGSGIRELRPWAVDVSSGVESARGVKDASAIHAFCDAVREADLRIEASVS